METKEINNMLRVHRLVFGLLILFVSALIGGVFGSYLHDLVINFNLETAEQFGPLSAKHKIISTLAKIIPVLSMGVVIAIAVRALNAAVVIRSFLEEGNYWQLVRPGVALMSATFLFGFSGIPEHPQESLATPALVLNMLDRIGIVTPGEGEPVARFIVTFRDEAKNRNNDGAFQKGIDLEDVQKMFLQDLVRDLSSCIENDSVLIKLRGFASTSGPLNTTERNFDYRKTNLDAAAQRARVVKSVMDKATKSKGISIEIEPWYSNPEEKYSLESYLNMKRAARFNDYIQDTYSTARGRLNRRVDIEIIDPGDCRASERIALSDTENG